MEKKRRKEGGLMYDGQRKKDAMNRVKYLIPLQRKKGNCG